MYPLRMSSSFWRIPISCIHTICSPFICGSNFRIVSENDIISLIIEQNDTCLQMSKLENTFIHLASFDISYPSGITGLLQNADQIVVPHNSFTIEATFPLQRPETMTITIDDDDGFTLRKLIHVIQKMYMDIYRIEEETTPETSFILYRECACVSQSYQDTLATVPLVEDCAICHSLEDYEQGCQLKCNHMFHKQCIDQWVETSSKTTCPLCRTDMLQCEQCNNSRNEQFTYTGRVIPPELRDGNLRNQTNGRYGIFDYDYHDLIIEEMYYCKHSRFLYLKMNVL